MGMRYKSADWQHMIFAVIRTYKVETGLKPVSTPYAIIMCAMWPMRIGVFQRNQD